MIAHEPIHLTGRLLDSTRHICAFFHSKEEEYRTLMDFIKEGFDHHERVFHIVDARQRHAHRSKLREEGIPVEEVEQSGQMKVICWEDAYLKDDYFDQDRQIRLLESVLQEGKQDGFPLTRLVANMEWALEEKAGVEEIVEYESRLNDVLPRYDDPVICTYDISRFNAGVAMDILRTHPMVILGGVLQENPLYVSPRQFLKELQEREEQRK